MRQELKLKSAKLIKIIVSRIFFIITYCILISQKTNYTILSQNRVFCKTEVFSASENATMPVAVLAPPKTGQKEDKRCNRHSLPKAIRWIRRYKCTAIVFYKQYNWGGRNTSSANEIYEVWGNPDKQICRLGTSREPGGTELRVALIILCSQTAKRFFRQFKQKFRRQRIIQQGFLWRMMENISNRFGVVRF